MGLYDNYRLANSSQIRQYQGSVVPELTKVSIEMQQRYDAAAEGQDYTRRFWNSMQSLDQDKAALQQMGASYQEKLKALSQRKDLENTLRETTMLAKDLPAAYAPFAQRMKDYDEYRGQLEKATREGKLSPQTAQRLIQLSNHRDGGIQMDPVTGRYSGRYRGASFVEDIDVNKKVDEWMDKAAAEKGSIKYDTVKGQWIENTGKSWDIMRPERIQQIIQSGAQNDQQFQAWLAQQQELGTFDKDYGKLQLSEEDLGREMGRIGKPGGKKDETIPVTLRDVLSQYQQRGISQSEALRDINRKGIGDSVLKGMFHYGVQKYMKNNVETEHGLSANQVWKWNQEEEQRKKDAQMLQFATTMTLGGADVKNIGDFEEIKGSTAGTHKKTQQSYQDWLQGVSDGRPKTWDAQGNVFYTDEQGTKVDVTADAKAFRDQIAHSGQQVKNIQAIEKAAAKASGWDRIPQSVKEEANRAATNAYHTYRPGTEATKGLSAESIRILNEGAAEDAKQNVLRNTKEYKRYQEELKKRFTGTAVGSDLFAFRDQKTVDAISEQVTNLVSGLGLEKGVIPVTDKDGKQLDPDQWEELQGEMKAIGVTYTGDPNSPVALVMRAFKDVKGKNTAGEDFIVKLPNTNIQQIAAEGMDEQQADYFRRASSLAGTLNNPFRSFSGNGVSIQANTSDPRGGWHVRKGNKAQTLFSFKDIFDFIDNTTEDTNGK